MHSDIKVRKIDHEGQDIDSRLRRCQLHIVRGLAILESLVEFTLQLSHGPFVVAVLLPSHKS